MQALNVRAEYRKAFPQSTITPSEDSLVKWADAKVEFDGWIKDDGEYYTREEWYAEAVLEAEAAEDNFRSWLDETEPEYQDRIGH